MNRTEPKSTPQPPQPSPTAAEPGRTEGPTLFEQMGGEPVLRAVMADFVARVYADVMIGFLFRNFDPERLERTEYQFAARALGADVQYEGRPLREAHAKHPIMAGQFARRKQILRDTLIDHGVPAAVREAWLAHVEKLRPLVTTQPGSTCVQMATGGPLVTHVPAEPPAPGQG